MLPWNRADVWASELPAQGWLGDRHTLHTLSCPFLWAATGGRDQERPTPIPTPAIWAELDIQLQKPSVPDPNSSRGLNPCPNANPSPNPYPNDSAHTDLHPWQWS